jgi:hypothetical protein
MKIHCAVGIVKMWCDCTDLNRAIQASTRSSQYRRVFIAPYPIGNNYNLRYWLQVPNLFIALLPAVVRSKKGLWQSFVHHWELGSFLPTAVRNGAESLKGSHRMGDGPIFLKASSPHSSMTTYRMNLLSAKSISLDSTFNLAFFFAN